MNSTAPDERTGKGQGMSRKNIVTAAGLSLLLAAVALFYQFGWQFTGFRMVTHPDLLLPSEVIETGDRLIVRGRTALSIGSYAGAVLEYEEGVLYIGVRFSLFGEDPDFEIQYPQSYGKVDRIVLRKNELYRTIWIRPWKEQAVQ